MLTFDDFLFENYEDDTINEDFADQMALLQDKLQKLVDRANSTKKSTMELNRAAAAYADKASKTKDPVSKTVYAAKMASNEAKRASNDAYSTYLQALQVYYQAKRKEISVKEKAASNRGN